MAARILLFVLLLTISISPVLCGEDEMSIYPIFVVCIFGVFCVVLACFKLVQNAQHEEKQSAPLYSSSQKNAQHEEKHSTSIYPSSQKVTQHVIIDFDSDTSRHLQPYDKDAYFKKYLERGDFQKGINWNHIEEEHRSSKSTKKGQFLTSSRSKLRRYFRLAARDYESIEDSYGKTKVVKATLNSPIGKNKVSGKKLRRILMVFDADFKMKSAYPIQ
ncbi:uncharacterized protein LOC130636482 [Hydractinia symbiolongicarpus]|uniref:uncharacterized protein LOC130636482 n=1 Tax=Hydractinia symbiolongicarpus TaxID=13093 RepID=UPI00254A3265|nr:uncharacterized protein LOC130636482 [Hydractinia symbiolongicarpus]